MTILDLGAWCILRCLGADTIKLAAALNLRGLRVWTPTEWSIGRMPKTRARYDKPTPMIAGYAFGDVRDIDELYRLAAIRDREIPHFRFLKSETLAGHTPLVADTEDRKSVV